MEEMSTRTKEEADAVDRAALNLAKADIAARGGPVGDDYDDLPPHLR